MPEEILVEQQQSIATVVLNRPERHNALTLGMYTELPGIVAALDANSSVKVIVLRGAGQRAFASGADISEFERERGNAVSARRYNDQVAKTERALEALEKPIIAMIHGHCIGGGAGLALACDMRFADSTSHFAITPAKLGLVYSLESTKRVVDLVGPARAKWILLSGMQIPAERALSLGLFDEMKLPEELEEFTYGFAETISSRAQLSVRMARQWYVALLSAKYTTTTQPAKFATYLSTQVTTQRVCRLSLRNDDQTFADPDLPCPCCGKLAQRPAGQIGTRRTDGDHARFRLPVYGLNRHAQQADVRRIRRRTQVPRGPHVPCPMSHVPWFTTT